MKHLKKYNESNFIYKDSKGNTITYYYEWAMPNSKIRKELNLDIDNILLEAKDLGYGAHTGWITEPYVWIGGKRYYNREEITPIVDRVISYLKSEGFNVNIDDLKNQVKITFN
jgi:hypothetical protein